MRTEPVKQRRAEALLQLCDLFAHRRLADVQVLGGLGKAAVAYHLNEGTQLFEFHNVIPDWNAGQSNNSF